MDLQSNDQVLDLIREWKLKDYSIVFTNGVFDILHLGHVEYLAKARQHGDKLIVGVNSDDSVRRLEKGKERPINPQYARATIVNSLKSVDGVLIFEEDTPLNLIKSIMPDVLIKGGDYDANEKDQSKKTYISGSEEVRMNGGVIIAVPLIEGYSTTSIIRKLRS